MSYRYLEVRKRATLSPRRWSVVEMSSDSDSPVAHLKSYLTKRGASKYARAAHWAALDA